MDEDKNLVRLVAFEFEYEAIMLRNALNDRGIPAWVTGGDGVNTFGAGLTAAGLVGVDVNVRQIDFELAKKIMAKIETNEDRVAVPEWVCKCSAEVDEGFAVCWSCGNEYSGFSTDEEDNW